MQNVLSNCINISNKARNRTAQQFIVSVVHRDLCRKKERIHKQKDITES